MSDLREQYAAASAGDSAAEAAPRAEGRAEPEREPRPEPRLRLSRRGRVVVGALLLAAVAAVVCVVLFSPLFALRAVSVSGTSAQLTRAQVLAAAEVPYGTPLPRLDTGAVRARVARKLPRAASVAVSRSWPDGITVRIVQRVAVAAVDTGTPGPSRYAEVDATGTRFASSAQPPSGMPVVRLRLSAAGRAALPVIPQDRLVAGAVAVARDLPQSVAARASALDVLSYDDIELGLPHGVLVKWGSPEDGARKAAVLTALMRGHPSAAVYDVSAPGSPAIRESGG